MVQYSRIGGTVLVQAQNPQIAAVLPRSIVCSRCLRAALGAQYATLPCPRHPFLLSEMRQAMLDGVALPRSAASVVARATSPGGLEAACSPRCGAFNPPARCCTPTSDARCCASHRRGAGVMTQHATLNTSWRKASVATRHHVEALLAELTGAEAATCDNNRRRYCWCSLRSQPQGSDRLARRADRIGGRSHPPRYGARGLPPAQVRHHQSHPSPDSSSHRRAQCDAHEVHTSNYAIQGFTASGTEKELRARA